MSLLFRPIDNTVNFSPNAQTVHFILQSTDQQMDKWKEIEV